VLHEVKPPIEPSGLLLPLLGTQRFSTEEQPRSLWQHCVSEHAAPTPANALVEALSRQTPATQLYPLPHGELEEQEAPLVTVPTVGAVVVEGSCVLQAMLPPA
jgi:hypothetical protein